MPNNRFRKKAKPRKKASKKAPAQATRKPKLTQDQMLARIPMGEGGELKEELTTEEVQHIWNDAHHQSIYKLNAKGILKPYRSRNSGKANVYKTSEVIEAIHARFNLRPISEDTTGSGSDQDEKKASKDRQVQRARRGSGTSRKAKAKRPRGGSS